MKRATAFGIGLSVIALAPWPSFAQAPPHAFVRDVAGEIACGPQAAFVPPASTLQITGSVNTGRALFATDDAVAISGGTAQGIEAGQVYFVRRAVHDRFTVPMSGGLAVTSIHTAGWLRITEAQRNTSTGVITRACDAMQTGDYLEPFQLPVVPEAAAPGQPDYSAPGRIILGDERRQLGGPGSLMVLDRGAEHGLKPGQRLTIYRVDSRDNPADTQVGEALALVVNAETALVRIEWSRDAVAVGDLVALQK